MDNSFSSRLKRAWNVFTNRDPTYWQRHLDSGMSYSTRPDRTRLTRGHERSIVNALSTRISMDAAAIELKHVRMDENGRFKEDIDSDLNNCLTLEANIDQTGRAFRQDIVMSMLDEGVVAVVPVDTEDDPDEPGSTKIYTMRTAKIVEWYPTAVRIRVYNDRKGIYEEVMVSKASTAIIENPFYSIMNEPNSISQRLIRKLNLLDVIDEQSGSGKLDLIIQLPYSLKSDLRKQQAEERRKDIEHQLAGSKYGIAYIDSTEHITQLNRGVENNLMNQIEYLTKMLYSQFGITEGILDGTANEETMINYHNRTIEPILSAISDEMTRKFLTETARTQGQNIYFFRDPFKLVSVTQLAEISDKMTRNEIMSSNEIRAVIGMKPSSDPSADELRNKNLNQSNANQIPQPAAMSPYMDEDDVDLEQSIAELDGFDSELDELERELSG